MATHSSIDAFELWCWRRLLQVLWTARRSNLSILKEISPEYSLDGLMLKLQYFGHLMGRTNPLEKTLILGKIEGREEGDDSGWNGWMASPTQWTWVWTSSGSWWWTGKRGLLQSMVSQSQTWLTELNWTSILAWEIPQTGSCGSSPQGRKASDVIERLSPTIHSC